MVSRYRVQICTSRTICQTDPILHVLLASDILVTGQQSIIFHFSELLLVLIPLKALVFMSLASKSQKLCLLTTSPWPPHSADNSPPLPWRHSNVTASRLTMTPDAASHWAEVGRGCQKSMSISVSGLDLVNRYRHRASDFLIFAVVLASGFFFL